MPTAVPDADLADLIQRCADGDGAALQRLYCGQAAQLLGIAQRILRDRLLAEDALQEAFIQIWRHAGRFNPASGSARAWIISIVRYRALDLRDATARQPRPDSVDLTERLEFRQDTDTAPPPAPEDVITLNRCLGKLPDGPRTSIALAYLEGCSHSEIAQRLKQPVGTVKSWILRGLDSLKRCLAQ